MVMYNCTVCVFNSKQTSEINCDPHISIKYTEMSRETLTPGEILAFGETLTPGETQSSGETLTSGKTLSSGEIDFWEY